MYTLFFFESTLPIITLFNKIPEHSYFELLSLAGANSLSVLGPHGFLALLIPVVNRLFLLLAVPGQVPLANVFLLLEACRVFYGDLKKNAEEGHRAADSGDTRRNCRVIGLTAQVQPKET